MNFSFVSWLRNKIAPPAAGHWGGRTLRQRPTASRRKADWVLAAEVQLLEDRALLSGNSAAQLIATIDLVRYHSGTVIPNASSTQPPPGYTPAQIKQAYGFNQISFNGTPGDGRGTTIAIVDAYDDPNIAGDLHQFDLAFGLPDPPSLTKVNQTGSTSRLPAANAGWITEIALDVEWAHAIAPGANILLVEAKSDYNSDLMAAVNTGRNYAGVNAVSMSWGGSEYSGETSEDSYFTTPGGHAGVTFVGSSGDGGAPISSPESSPNVVSVGGTTLDLGSGGSWSSETGWSGSGGGISAYEAQPSYQKGIVTQTTTMRANPDVAYDADPNTGFGVYDSYNNGTTNPWGQWGGTSDAAPQWAALIAIADEGRALAGKGSLDGATQTLPMLYSMSTKDFHDITSGTSTGTPNDSAGPGYDLVTGRGTPYANLVVNDLVGTPVIVPPSLGNAFDLSGAWIVDNVGGVALGLGQIIQSGASLTFVNDNGVSSSGQYTSPNQVVATNFDGQASVAGAIDTTAADEGRVLFADGTVWLRVSLGGQYSVTGAGINSPTLASITQNGASLTLVSAGTSSSATITSATQLQVSIGGGSIALANYGDGQISFSSNGQVWTKLDLPTSFTSSLGGQAQIIQHGTTSLVFVNNLGQTSPGYWISPTRVIATGFANETGTFSFGQLIWSTGEVWTENLVLQGSKSGPGVAAGGTTDLAAGSAVVVNDYAMNGRTAHVIQSGTTTVVLVKEMGQVVLGNWINATQVSVPAWGNDVATFSPGKINWSDGALWTMTTTAAPQITVTDFVISGRLAHLIQNGTQTLVFINENGSVVLGSWISPQQTVVPGWGNDVATFSAGRINWSDGNSWTQNASFSFPVTSLDFINQSNGLTAHLVQNTTGDVTFVNEFGSIVLGMMSNPTQATVVAAWGNDVATFSPGKINWSDGSVWTQTGSPANKLSLTGYVIAADGRIANLVQNGSSTGVFINPSGMMALGMFNGGTATVAAWNGDVATFTNGNIHWSDGSVWNQALPQPLSIAATDVNGAVAHVQLLSATTLVGLDGGLSGVSGTRSNGQIVWSNGVVWTDFDLDALNALFEMATGYP